MWVHVTLNHFIATSLMLLRWDIAAIIIVCVLTQRARTFLVLLLLLLIHF